MSKVVALGISAGILGLGMTGMLRFKGRDSSKLKDDIAAGNLTEPRQFACIDAGAELALRSDDTLYDIVDRLAMYGRFDEQVWDEVIRAAASTSEFLIRKDEVQHKRSVPLLFRGHIQTMLTRLRELRRAIRDSQPSVLEDFDDIVSEIKTFQQDMHHNLWCDSQA